MLMLESSNFYSRHGFPELWLCGFVFVCAGGNVCYGGRPPTQKKSTDFRSFFVARGNVECPETDPIPIALFVWERPV